MKLIGFVELVKPSICMICRERPGEKQKVVDTGQYLQTMHPGDPMAGRIYVCDRCGLEIAKQFKLVPDSAVKAAEAAQKAAEAKVVAFKALANLISEKSAEFTSESVINTEAEAVLDKNALAK